MDDTVQHMLTMLQEMNAAICTLVSNQENLKAEQDRAAKALGEAGGLLKIHANVLRQLWEHVGLPTDDSPPESTSSVN